MYRDMMILLARYDQYFYSHRNLLNLGEKKYGQTSTEKLKTQKLV